MGSSSGESRRRFEDKVVIVTGASSGIGRETARRFAAEGAAVVVADLDEDGGKKTLDILKESGGPTRYIRTDVSDPDSVESMVNGDGRVFRRTPCPAQQRILGAVEPQCR